MNKVAIAFSTCDRVELSRQSIKPLCQPDKFDLHWIDGSKTDEGMALPYEYKNGEIHTGVRGGSGAAIVYALTEMLNSTVGYEYVGLVENDVVLQPGWFDDTFSLFERGKADGLEVGAVSARCYEDRVLIQRDGYAVMHNTGAGMVIFSRASAQMVLDQYRVQWTTDNRSVFAQLAGVDIGRYWAFRGGQHFLVADWRWDALLASKGLASAALTPSRVDMVGQTPPLAEQGLVLAAGPVQGVLDEKMFKLYCGNLGQIRNGSLTMPDSLFYTEYPGMTTIFAHQIASLGGRYMGEWRLRDSPGYGPFAWRANAEGASLTVPVFGSCEVLVSGGKEGGQVEIMDEDSGFSTNPILPLEGETGQTLSALVPGGVAYRNVRVTALTPGVTFFALRVAQPQPISTGPKFNYHTLPPV